jgi:hypothetical protein
MAAQWTTNRQFTLPAGASGVTVTPSGVAGTPGSWALLGTPDSSGIITGLSLRLSVLNFIVVEIGVGSLPSPVVVDRFAAYVPTLNGGVAAGLSVLNRVIPVDALVASQPVYARVASSTTSVTGVVAALLYMKNPIVGNLQVSENPTQVFPPTAIHVLNGGTPAWDAGTAETLIASAATDLAIEAVIIQPGSNTAKAILELLVDGTPIFRHCVTSYNLASSGPYRVPVFNPNSAIEAGDEVEALVYTEDAGLTTRVALEVKELPL